MSVRDLSVDITAGELTFDTDDIIQVDIQRSITDGSFGIGFTQSDMLRFTAVSSAKLAKKTLCTLNIAPGGRFGKYYVEECTRDGSQINVTAFDAMYYQGNAHVRFNGKASISLERLTFPCLMQDVLDYLCTLRRMTCSFQCQPFTVQKKPRKPDGTYFTVRELIGFIAASHGCNAKFDNRGHLVFRYFSDSEEELTVSDVVDLILDDGEPFEVTGILFSVDGDNSIYVDSVPGSEYDEDDVGVVKCYNPLATVEIANYAWTQIGGLAYYGGSVTMRGTDSIDCGDVLTVKNLKYPSDEDDYKFCVTDISYTISAESGFMETITSQADKTDNGSPPVSNVKQVAYGETTDPLETSGALIRLADFWFKTDNGGKLKAIYQCDQSSSNEKEWKQICLAGGGVGENLSPYSATAERFNDYDAILLGTQGFDANDPTGGSFSTCPMDHVEGYHNYIFGNGSISGGSLTGNGANHASGQHNIIRYCQAAGVIGKQNTLTSSDCTWVSGASLTVSGSNWAFVSGVNVTVSASDSAVVFANGGSVTNSTNAVNIGGYNRITDSAYARCIGNSNQIKALNSSNSSQSTCIGDTNVIEGSSGHSVCIGGSNHIKSMGQSAVCLGENAEIDGTVDNTISFAFGSSASGNILTIDKLGNLKAKGSYGTMGADYAEYFEWADGNPNNEDRRGMFVALDGDKIIPAHGDDFIGVISVNPSVVGNAYEMYWHGKYKTDAFGEVMRDEAGKAIISDEYDPNRRYIPRSKRPEWAAVGLVGILIIVDNGSCIPGKYVSARNGIGTHSVSPTAARVLRRIDETHIEVLINRR